MSLGLLLMDRSPRIRDRTLNILQRNSWLFERLLQLHIGHAPLAFTEESGLRQPTPTAKQLKSCHPT